MKTATASQKELSKMTALKLTIFTPTQITTASHYDAINVKVAANAPEPAAPDCITLSAVLRARHRGSRVLKNDGNAIPQENWRIPFPTNDNMPIWQG
jgi:hypothetical protein